MIEIEIPDDMATIMKNNTPSKSEFDEISRWIVGTATGACRLDPANRSETVDEECFEEVKSNILSMLKIPAERNKTADEKYFVCHVR